MLIVPPNSNYSGYINSSVLIMLFCLMVVVAGLNSIGLFEKISSILLSKVSDVKSISFILVNLCYFLAMFITNDVALITIVPLTLSILKNCDINKIIKIVVMESIAANLGSIMTPIGNPQNIFIYEHYGLSIQDFFRIMLPLGLISLIVINGTLLGLKSKKILVKNSKEEIYIDKKSMILYLTMFILCILTILNIISHITCLILILILVIFTDFKVLKKVDYMLLLTFISFFIFVGNISSIDIVKDIVYKCLQGREVIISVLLSQVISNVPATLMLSSFTQDFKNLLIGVNIGGLGTLIASLASLISFKIFSKSYPKDNKKFLKIFSIYNFSFLIMLLVCNHIIF